VPPSPKLPPEPSPLLRRLDALADLAHRRHGLLLAPDGQLTNADAAAVAHAIGIEPGRGGGVELLLLLGIAVGVLQADGLRVRAAPLHDAWRQLDDTLRRDLSSPPGASTRRFHALQVVYPGLSGGELLDPCASDAGTPTPPT